jgi:hypothetical protein
MARKSTLLSFTGVVFLILGCALLHVTVAADPLCVADNYDANPGNCAGGSRVITLTKKTDVVCDGDTQITMTMGNCGTSVTDALVFIPLSSFFLVLDTNAMG